MENNQLHENDFSTPRRMSKSALVVICYNEFKQYLSLYFLVILMKFFNSEKQASFLENFGKLLLMFGILIVLTLAIGYLKYHFKRFYVKDGNLVFMHGIIHRETTNIPVYKIHSMRTKRGLIYRMLDMKGISFDTLASKEEEIELILDDSDWNALLHLVETEEQKATESKTEIKDIAEQDPNQEETSKKAVQRNSGEENTTVDENLARERHDQTIKFSNLNLIKGAFCQNHLKGMAVFGSALLALYGQVAEYSDKAIIYAYDYLAATAPEVSFSLTTFVIALTVLYIFMMILWIGKVFLRYFNMEVRMNKTQLFFEGGLFTRLSSQFSYDKVCTVYIKQNFLEKWMNCCTLNLKQALNATDKKDESDVKIYGSNKANQFLDWWLGKDFASSEEIITAHSGNGLLAFTMRFDIIITLAALITLAHFEEQPWMIIPAFYMLISFAKGMCAVYRSSIVLKDGYLVVHNGRFADIQNFIKYSNVEVVRLVHTPFTPYFHRVSLTLATNGTSFVIRSLKEEEAKRIYELLLSFCRNEELNA